MPSQLWQTIGQSFVAVPLFAKRIPEYSSFHYKQAKTTTNNEKFYFNFSLLSHVFGSFRTCLDAFRYVRMHSDAFRCIRMRSDAFGRFRKVLANLKRID